MGCALRYSDYATRIFAEAERSRVALQGYFVATAVAIRVMEGVANALDPDVADLFGNQPLRREFLKYSRTALSRPRGERFGSLLNETMLLSSPRRRRSVPTRNKASDGSCLELLISAQVQIGKLALPWIASSKYAGEAFRG